VGAVAIIVQDQPVQDQPAEKRLVAFLVEREPGVAADLRPFLGRRLPAYMVPARVISLDALPLTVNVPVPWKTVPSSTVTAPTVWVPLMRTV